MYQDLLLKRRTSFRFPPDNILLIERAIRLNTEIYNLKITCFSFQTTPLPKLADIFLINSTLVGADTPAATIFCNGHLLLSAWYGVKSFLSLSANWRTLEKYLKKPLYQAACQVAKIRASVAWFFMDLI